MHLIIELHRDWDKGMSSPMQMDIIKRNKFIMIVVIIFLGGLFFINEAVNARGPIRRPLQSACFPPRPLNPFEQDMITKGLCYESPACLADGSTWSFPYAYTNNDVVIQIATDYRDEILKTLHDGVLVPFQDALRQVHHMHKAQRTFQAGMNEAKHIMKEVNQFYDVRKKMLEGKPQYCFMLGPWAQDAENLAKSADERLQARAKEAELRIQKLEKKLKEYKKWGF